MHIRQEFVGIALDNARKSKDNLPVKFNQNTLREYIKTLRKMSQRSKYTDGDDIRKTDLDTIKDNMKKLYDGAAENFAAESKEFKKETDVKDFVFAAHDYLFALTMKELNSPEIPTDSMRELIHDVSAKIIKAQPVENDISIDRTHKDQRGMSAKKILNGKVGFFLDKIDSNDYFPAQMGELFAQYKALEKRQKNHGAIWRFFHSKENKERNDLLKLMEDCMKKRIPEEDFKKIETPDDIINYHEWSANNKRFEFFIAQREQRPDMAYGYTDYYYDPEKLDEYNKNANERDNDYENQLLNDQLKNDTSEIVSTKSERQTEPPSKASPNIKVDM